MIFIDTHSDDVFFNFGCEVYFAEEKPFPDDVFLLWRTTPTLMIGKYQNALEEIDASYARERGITVVRRLSGGGTIYTDMGGWQFSYITRAVGQEIEFDRFVQPVVRALRGLGLDAVPTGRNDITVGGKKCSGNAQFRLGAAVVHHGSLLYDTDLEELVRSTTPQPYKITSKAIQSVRERVTNLRDALPEDRRGLTTEEFRAYLIGQLTDSVSELTDADCARIREIGDERFRDPRVIYAAAPKFEMEKTIHTPGGTFVIGLAVRHGVIAEATVTGDFFSGTLTSEGIAGILTGVEFTPTALRSALSPLAGQLYRVEIDELVRGIVE